jgi:hypothetical protein
VEPNFDSSDFGAHLAPIGSVLGNHLWQSCQAPKFMLRVLPAFSKRLLPNLPHPNSDRSKWITSLSNFTVMPTVVVKQSALPLKEPKSQGRPAHHCNDTQSLFMNPWESFGSEPHLAAISLPAAHHFSELGPAIREMLKIGQEWKRNP